MEQVYKQDVLKQILDYLEPDRVNCLYLLVDLSRYGLANQNIRVWYDQDEQGIRMVVMQYHKSFQVYSNRSFDKIDELTRLIKQQRPHCISAREEIIRSLERHMPRYCAEYGVVVMHPDATPEELQKVIAGSSVTVSLAGTEDVKEIARLICSDERLGAPYTVETLAEELRERMETGMGRSFIIRDRGKIVAHEATYAEGNTLSISGGVIVHPSYRGKGYFDLLNSFAAMTVKKEEKRLYRMVLDSNSRLLEKHKQSGCMVVSRYGKLSFMEKETEAEV